MRLKAILRRVLDSCAPTVRLVVYGWVVRSGRRVDSRIFRLLAQEFIERGSIAHAYRSWRLEAVCLRYTVDDLIGEASTALRGESDERVRWLVREIKGLEAFPPGYVVWLAGMLAARQLYVDAGQLLGRFGDPSGQLVHAIPRSPSLVLRDAPRDLHLLTSQLQALDSGDATGLGEVGLSLARLCFTFRKLEPASSLYALASTRRQLPPLDTVAAMYAGARSGSSRDQIDPDALSGVVSGVAGNPDALTMVAYAASVAGQHRLALTAIDAAARSRFSECPDSRQVAVDCRVIAELVFSRVGQALTFSDTPDAVRRDGIGDAVPKVFISGFGWSGSGAIYDDIRGLDGFAEFQGAGDAPLLNADSDTEPTFIQGEGGLGALWLKALQTGRIDWGELWDTFRLHVIGTGTIGYNEYKSGCAAGNSVRCFGAAYTGAFRRLFEGLNRLAPDASIVEFRALLEEAGESLCRMLLARTGAKAVLFNNAVFGRGIGMLEIFSNVRAAVVFRDPLDVYADRVRSDKNHWRSPEQMSQLYDAGMRQYLDCRESDRLPPDVRVREVPFEKFITDAAHREQVRAWLLGESVVDTGASYLDPTASRQNIGIGEAMVSRTERGHMRQVIGTHARMMGRANRVWSRADI